MSKAFLKISQNIAFCKEIGRLFFCIISHNVLRKRKHMINKAKVNFYKQNLIINYFLKTTSTFL